MKYHFILLVGIFGFVSVGSANNQFITQMAVGNMVSEQASANYQSPRERFVAEVNAIKHSIRKEKQAIQQVKQDIANLRRQAASSNTKIPGSRIRQLQSRLSKSKRTADSLRAKLERLGWNG